MVIHYLQNCNPPVLPHLQHIWGDDFFQQLDSTRCFFNLTCMVQNLVKKTFICHNNWSLGILFNGFMHYYSQVSIYNQIISISYSLMHSRYHDSPSLVIEEPFEKKNTAYSINSEKRFEKIKQVFFETFNAICNRSFTIEEFEYYN